MSDYPSEKNVFLDSLNPKLLFDDLQTPEIDLPCNIYKYFNEFYDNYEIDYDNDGNFKGIIKNEEFKDEEEFFEFELSSDIFETNDETEELVEKPKLPEVKTYKNRVYSYNIPKNWKPEKYFPELELPFEPDIFQHQSFYFLSKNESILVTAHTSSGKTTIVDYAIKMARLHKTKVIYTSPIKALSNQKYNDFKHYQPGIITGDVSLNPEADVLIMTTEVLRNFLYSKNQIIHNVEFVIFDEVHYINNKERGVVWEECIILLPRYITIGMLSACIPNATEFGAWVGRIRGKTIYVVETDKRVVPLEYLLCEDECIKYIKGGNTQNKKEIRSVKSAQKNIAGGRKKDNLLYLVNYVTKSNLIPAIFFCFSKRKCHDYCRRIIRPFLRENEKKEILSIIKTRFNAKLSLAEQNLPQVVDVKEMLINGVGVHHSGLLPILKELVEILFSKNLVKILFATETFSMGVNFPAKSVVFISLKKMDDRGLRLLTPGEFMQMSGRAGRRGIDKKGVIIVNHENEKYSENIEFVINNLIKSSTYLISRFKLTFNMILQLIRSKAKAEDILRKSFCEEDIQKNQQREVVNLMKLELIYKERYCSDSSISGLLTDLKLQECVSKCSICKDIYEYIEEYKCFYNENNLLVQTYNEHFQFDQNYKFITYDHKKIGYKELVTYSVEKKRMLIDGIDFSAEYNEYPRFMNTTYQIYSLKDILYLEFKDNPFFDYKFDEYQNVVKEIQIKSKFNNLELFTCIRCPMFEQHYEEALEKVVLSTRIDKIKLMFDDKSLSLFEDYFEKLQFLQKYNYIDIHNNILIKGRIACEIRTVDEIVATEILVNNYFDGFDFAEIMSFVSGLIVKEEIDQENMDKINWVVQNIKDIYPFEFYNGYCRCVHDWCKEISLSEIVTNHRISEGVMVRTILRLNEFCKEMLNACALVNELGLYERIESGMRTLKRDIVHCHSMYFDE